MRKSTNNDRIAIRAEVDAETHHWLKVQAATEDLTLSELVGRILVLASVPGGMDALKGHKPTGSESGVGG